MKRTTQVAIVLAISMLLVACGEQAPQPGITASPAVDADSLPEPVGDDDAGSLHERAAQALADHRMVSPAGRNAVEYYLAARQEEAGDGRAQAALLELQPYLLIALEQALGRGDAPEAARLLSLVARIDTHAPALPRLKAALAGLQLEQMEKAQREATADAPSPTLPAAGLAPVPAPVTATTAVTTSPAQSAPLSAAPREAASVDAVPATAAPASPARAPDVVTSAAPAVTPRAVATRTPRLLQDVPPRYPLPALRAGMEGQAEVAFTIQPDGSVRNVQLVSSTPPGVFDASAVAVAQRWRFEATGQVHALRRTVLFRLPAGEAGGG